MSRSRGAIRLTTRSPIEISPAVIDSSPASIRNAVVLPEPEGPTSTMNSPSAISSERSRTASTVPPNVLPTSEKVTPAMSALHRPGQHPADEVPLEEHVQDDDRERHDHRARGEQRQVGGVAALEEGEAE